MKAKFFVAENYENITHRIIIKYKQRERDRKKKSV